MYEINAKTLLLKRKMTDSWFLSRYGVNLYRGCAHGCVYCDGRSESYRVQGDFEKDVAVKVNAPEVLDRELDSSRWRKPRQKGFVALGGGVGDSYQPAEAVQRVSRRCLEVLLKRNWPVHLLTKSNLLLRDMDLLKEFQSRGHVIVSVSLSSVDERLSALAEPGASSVAERLEVVEQCRRAGIPAGILFMPVLPFLSDLPGQTEALYRRAAQGGASYVLAGGLTLKPGRQKDFYMKFLREFFSEEVDLYDTVYDDQNPYGSPSDLYQQGTDPWFLELGQHFALPPRIPVQVGERVFDKKEQVLVLLRQIHDLRKMQGERSSFAQAARSLESLTVPLTAHTDLRDFKGVGPGTAGLIREFLKNGRCGLYDSLMGFGKGLP